MSEADRMVLRGPGDNDESLKSLPSGLAVWVHRRISATLDAIRAADLRQVGVV
jgi:hypothetical protein